MSRAKQRPRDWLIDPQQFGREPKPEWLDAEPGTFEHALRRAAQVQHYVVYLMRGRIEHEERTWAQIARNVAVPYHRLMEIVRGEQPIALADLIDLGREFGPLFIETVQLKQAMNVLHEN